MASKSTKGPRGTRQAADPAVTIALHHVGGAWQGIAVRRDGSSIRVLETRSLGEGDRRAATRWVEDRRAGRILLVLPSSQVVCRSCALPDAPADRLRTALELQSEAHLSAAAPAHRLAMAVLPKSINRAGDGGRTGLLVGWPESAAPRESPIGDPLTDVAPTYVADIAALAALLCTAAGRSTATHGSGEPHVGASLWLDRAEGAVAVAVPASAGLAFRATRADFSDPTESRRDVVRAVAETLLSVGESAPVVHAASEALAVRLEQDPGASLVVPPSLAASIGAAVEGVPTDPSWWDRHGIALGAALCAEGELEPLTRLERDRPVTRPTPGARIAGVLARPRTAVLLALLGVVAIAVAPLALARIRLAVLQLKVPDLKSLAAQNQEDARRRAMYSEMRRQTWPIAKILADVANCTPEGVVVEEVSVDRGQGLAIRGVASPFKGATGNDRVLAMHAAMERTGVFSLVKVDRDPADGPDTITFRLTANVVDPYRDYQWTPEEDFAVSSLAMRRYGKETTPGVEVPPAPTVRDEATSEEHSEPAHADATSPPVAAVAAATPAEPTAPQPAARSAGPSRRSATREGADGASAEAVAVAPAGEAKPGDVAAPPPSESGEAGEASGASESSDRARGDGRNVARRGDSAASGKASGAASRGDRSGPSGPEIPEPLTDEAISAMSKAEATAALAKVAKARQNSSLDEETAARLRSEFDKLLQQTKQLKETK